MQSPMFENVQIPITWKYSVESHIPRLWVFEEIFPSSWKIDGNTHIFPIHGSGEIFPVHPYNFQNMGKVNFHSKEKIQENTNIQKLRVS